MTKPGVRPLDRRQLLRGIAYGAAAVPLLQACGDDGGSGKPDASTGDAPPTRWASGGTAAMTDKPTYPDPFATPVTACMLLPSTTIGPCTTEADLDREDISEGLTGLPVRLALKVVDGNCNPLSGVTVKIWHTNIEGSYSGQTPNNTACLSMSSYSAMNFMRGARTTAADGTVYFDTCFPGWYAGRAIHLHVQAKMGTTSTIVSQLVFPDDINTEIFREHPEYIPFGQPDRTNSSDSIVGGMTADARERMMLDVAHMTDGAMLASKVITIV